MPYRRTLKGSWIESFLIPAAGLHRHGSHETLMFDDYHRDGVPKRMITIGRRSGLDITVPDPYVSVDHAFLMRSEDGVTSIHCHPTATNSTKVNGERIYEPTALYAGMQVRIGQTRFIAVNANRQAPILACSVREFTYRLNQTYRDSCEAGRRVGPGDVSREFIRLHAQSWDPMS